MFLFGNELMILVFIDRYKMKRLYVDNIKNHASKLYLLRGFSYIIGKD